jgi:hypothetical protein
VAALGDLLPLPLAALILVSVAGLVALAWYHHPAWLPRRRPPRPPRPPRGRPVGTDEAPAPAADPPAPPAAGSPSPADRYAAEGRYAEAVRERLRAVVGDLVDRRVLEHRPGMTVAELTDSAARARPGLAAPLTAAAGIFSDLWYARRPARAEHDEAMRALTAEVHRVLAATGEHR